MWGACPSGRERLLASLESVVGKDCPPETMAALVEAACRHTFAVPPAWRGRLGAPGSPLWRQCVPDPRELVTSAADYSSDPLDETRYAVLPGAIRRYPDRLLVLLSDRCAGYCRFCTRRRMVGQRTRTCGGQRTRTGGGQRTRTGGGQHTRTGGGQHTRTGGGQHTRTGGGQQETVPPDAVAVPAERTAVTGWLQTHPEVRDVLLSGGDPLTLSDDEIKAWLREIRAVRPDVIIRIGTRMPSFAPERVTESLCRLLAGYGPLYINVHFNHTDELSEAARDACLRMSRQGLIVGNQSVLLAGVNDSTSQLRELSFGLLSCGVRPYYLHLLDQVAGIAHFRVPLARAAAIWEELALTTSGMAVPRMMIDLPAGGGKIQYMRGMLVEDRGQGQLVFRNVSGGLSYYRDAESAK